MQKHKILIVDDEVDLCEILQFNFEQNGFVADKAYSGEEALKKNLESYSLFLLDVMMDGISGFELLQYFRLKRKLATPVIFITALGNEENVLKGFKIGASDYIKKPFSVKEVIARTNAVLERINLPKTNHSNNTFITIDAMKKQIFIDDTPVDFTKTEYDIFSLLYNKPGKVYSREEILNTVWADEYVLGRTVDVNITRIRKKLKEKGVCIATRSGYGYYFDEKKTAELSIELKVI